MKYKIEPIGKNIYLKIEQLKAGVLQLESRDSAIEYGEVLACGKDVKMDIKKGDKVFVKAWAVDIITFGEDKFYFVNEDTGGILAKVK